MTDHAPLTEPIAVTDCFVTELVRVENIGGGCYRFVFVAQTLSVEGVTEKQVVARLIAHESAIGPAIGKVLEGVRLGAVIDFWPQGEKENGVEVH